MNGADLFDNAQHHAKQARDLRRVAAGRQPGMRRLLQGHARTHEAMVRVLASVAVIDACDARFARLQEGR